MGLIVVMGVLLAVVVKAGTQAAWDGMESKFEEVVQDSPEETMARFERVLAQEAERQRAAQERKERREAHRSQAAVVLLVLLVGGALGGNLYLRRMVAEANAKPPLPPVSAAPEAVQPEDPVAVFPPPPPVPPELRGRG